MSKLIDSVGNSGTQRSADGSRPSSPHGASRPELSLDSPRIPAGCDRITPQMLPLIQLSQSHIDRIVQTVPGGAANVQDIYPLSSLQEGLLFHRLMGKHGDTYVLTTMFELRSVTQIQELRDALQKAIDRHDALRTAVLWANLPQPVQVVYRAAQLQIEELDRELCSADQLEALLNPLSERIDLHRAPLMRLQVIQDS